MNDQEKQDLVIAEGRVGEMLLAKYDPQQYHVIVPTHVITIPEDIMELGVSVVHLSPNPKDKMVYSFPEAGQGMVALAKKGMEAIANAAGLTDEPSRQVAFESGRYAIAEATVSVTLPTGERIQRTRQKCIDVEIRVKECEYNLRDRIEKGQENRCQQGRNESDEDFAKRREKYIEDRCMKRRLQLEKFLWELANTGAHLRAMKALLPSLKEIYHHSELQRPFIVPRISIRPAVASNKLLAAAMGARARRDMNHLYGDEDLYEELDPEVAVKLRDKDAALAELADEVENGELMREALADKGPPADDQGWQVLQEAYNGDIMPIEITVIESGSSANWPSRPWDAETLKRAMEKKVAAYKGKSKEPSEKQLDYCRSTLGKLGLIDPERHTLTLYLFDAEGTGDLSAAQCSTLIDWIGAKPPGYEPSEDAIEEARRVIRQYQIEKGQAEMELAT